MKCKVILELELECPNGTVEQVKEGIFAILDVHMNEANLTFATTEEAEPIKLIGWKEIREH